MKLIHNVLISVFEKDESRIKTIKKTLVDFVPLDFEKEKLKVIEEKASGLEGNPIHIIKLFLEKQRHVKAFFESFNNKLTRLQRNLILKQKETRLDDDLHFFIRFKKKELEAGKRELTETGDCYHINFCIAAFPKKKEIGLKIVEELFS